MADIKIQCPHCSQHLDAPSEMAGQEIDCPACGGRMVIPAARHRTLAPGAFGKRLLLAGSVLAAVAILLVGAAAVRQRNRQASIASLAAPSHVSPSVPTERNRPSQARSDAPARTGKPVERDESAAGSWPRLRNDETERSYLIRPEADIDVATGSLLVARGCYPHVDIPSYIRVVDEMTRELRVRLRGKTEPAEIVRSINSYLFEDKGFSYEAGTHYLNEVLDRKQGSCVGLSTLYVAITDRLGIPCAAVSIPRHEFVRFDDGQTTINIEVIAGGAEFSDDWYARECGIGAEAVRKGVYLQNMTSKELLAAVLSNRGNARREEGDHDEAIRDLSLALTYHPASVDALYSRGLARAENGDPDKGIADCNAALRLDAECAYAYADRGIAYRFKKDVRRALADFNRAISIDPDTAEFYADRGRLHQDSNDIESALRDYERALRMNPDIATAHFGRGQIQLNMRDIEGAIVSFGKAIENNPKHDLAYQNRGILRAMTGDPAGAVSDCDKAVALAPESAGAYLMRAMVHGLRKDKRSALPDIKQALRLDPDLEQITERNEAFQDWWSDADYQAVFR